MAGVEQKNSAIAIVVLVLQIALAVGSCTRPSEPGAPRVQDNICAIFAERPEWYRAAVAAHARWQAPVELQMAIIWKESSFRAEARPPQTYTLGVIPSGRASSAYGFAQAIDGTWEWYQRETGRRDARRNRFEDAVDFIGWYLDRSRRVAGIGPFDAFSHYIAYHQGHSGFSSGRWKANGWLQGAATRVADRTALYRGQLRSC